MLCMFFKSTTPLFHPSLKSNLLTNALYQETASRLIVLTHYSLVLVFIGHPRSIAAVIHAR